MRFGYGVFTLSDRPSQTVHLPIRFLTLSSSCRTISLGPATPWFATAASLHKPGLGSSAFARHYSRNHGCFLFLEVLRCFSSLGCLTAPMDSVQCTSPSRLVGCPIRTSTTQRLLTAPRGISVFAPSFFGAWHLGILRAPFLTSPCAPLPRLLSSQRNTSGTHAPRAPYRERGMLLVFSSFES